jgi:hypothetical protein
MKIRMVVTLDVDRDTWATEYGLPATDRAVRDDALMHLRNTVYGHYVNELSIARDATVTTPARSYSTTLR